MIYDFVSTIIGFHTLVPTLATTTVLGAMLGAIAQNRVRKWRLERSLRRALRSEISQIDIHQRNRSYLKDHLLNDEYSIAPTTVFEENAANIGVLSDAEIESIVALYSAMDRMRGEVRSVDRSFTEDTAMDRVDDLQDEISENKADAIDQTDSNLSTHSLLGRSIR